MALALALEFKALALGASPWFGPWSLKSKNYKMNSKLLLVFISLIAAKLVINQIHFKCEW